MDQSSNKKNENLLNSVQTKDAHDSYESKIVQRKSEIMGNIKFKSVEGYIHENYKISSLVSIINLGEVEESLSNLTVNYSCEDLSKEKNFEFSVGARSALSLLNTMESEKFYDGIVPRNEVIWALRLFLQFTGRTLKQDNIQAWEEISEFLIDIRDKEKHQKNIDNILIGYIHSFDFSDENVDKLEVMVSGKSLDPQQFIDICAVSGLLMFTIREAAVYAGIIEGKVPPFRKYARLLHKKALLEMY